MAKHIKFHCKIMDIVTKQVKHPLTGKVQIIVWITSEKFLTILQLKTQTTAHRRSKAGYLSNINFYNLLQ